MISWIGANFRDRRGRGGARRRYSADARRVRSHVRRRHRRRVRGRAGDRRRRLARGRRRGRHGTGRVQRPTRQVVRAVDVAVRTRQRLLYRQMTKAMRLLVRDAAILVQRIIHRAGRDGSTARGRIAIHHHEVLSMDVVIIIRGQEEEDDDDDERASKSPPDRRNSMTDEHRASSTTQ